jgi:transmembrane sensor
MDSQPSHNAIWFLIARSLANEASPEEEKSLQQILQQDFSLQQQYDLLKRTWHAEPIGEDKDHEEEKQNVSHILELASIENRSRESEEAFQVLKSKPKRRKIIFYSIGTAAAVIFLIGAVWIFNRDNDSISTKSKPVETLATENGSRTRTILPDGSSVWLNAGSHISYDKDFSGALREVKLDGEAYFDVVKDPQHPFIVHVSGYDIKVLGTVFDVKSYPKDKTVETTLLRGIVQVTKHNEKNHKPIVLYPNEKLIVEKNAADNVLALPDTKNADKKNYTIKILDSTVKETDRIETAWVYNRLEFNNDSFEELADKLERWYNVRIIFDDDDVKNLHLHGSFENETIEQALADLKLATPFNYEIQGKEIHIMSVAKN